MAAAVPDAPRTAAIEVKSIDYVPLDERGGKPSSLFSLWFMSNANLTTLATGMVGVAMGADFVTSILAVLLGAAVGTVFTAFHSAQGPQLGLPQMIQSRAQFGYRGVVVMCLVVIASIVGFNIFNQILAADVARMITTVDAPVLWYTVITALALALAIFGYHWIHRAQQWLTWVFLATFGLFSVLSVFFLPMMPERFWSGSINWPAFLVQFGAASAYALGWAPYVSDYSRYLPPQTSPAKALFHTYSGVFVGGSWLMILGAFVASLFAGVDPILAVRQAADEIFPGFGLILLVAALPALITVITVNIYAAALEVITSLDSLRGVRATRRLRIVSCTVVAVAGFLGAALSSGAFLDSFGSFLVVLLYVLVPWTSVNLVDYYLVRRGTYAVAQIFEPRGIYGSWGWRGLTAYAAGIVAMVPFASTVWYTGPIAELMGGIDIALFAGLLVSGGVYMLLGRSLDLTGERALAAEESARTGIRAVSFSGR